MKMLNKKFVRTLSCAAVAVCAAAMLSVGAFAAEVDSTCVEGYLPPQEQMVQGDIALHSADVAVGEKDPSYGGYGAPEGNPIQGNIMLISGDELADTAKTEARYTVKGLLGKQLLYTARQKDGVLTLDVPAEVATFRTTIEDMQTLQANGVKTLVLVTEKNSTTHSQLTDAELAEQQIYQNTIRLSIGTEHIDDILADLEAGFAAVRGK